LPARRAGTFAVPRLATKIAVSPACDEGRKRSGAKPTRKLD